MKKKAQALAGHNTLLSQLLKLVPIQEFETLANQHHERRVMRKMTRWSQFVAMALAQFSGRASLRDVASNLSTQRANLYHLGAAVVSRSTLARINEKQPYSLYEQLAGKLLARCPLATGSGSRTSSTRLTLPPSICVSANFPGPISAPLKAR